MNIIIKEYEPIDMAQVLALYNSARWTNYTDHPSMLESAIKNSLKTLAAYAGDKLVGLIRAVGDGHSIIYIQDIIVLPEHQNQGIGRSLVKEIDLLYPHVYQKVLLTDNEPRSIRFYERCGFSLSSDFRCVAFVKFST